MSAIVRPRFGKIPTAVRYSGVSRSRLYEWARQYNDLMRKNGVSTLIDFDVLDRILDALPFATIEAQRRTTEEVSGRADLAEMAIATGSPEPVPMEPLHCTPKASSSVGSQDHPTLYRRERSTLTKNRKRESRTTST
jgi:hypothetical protein